tara:strand:+ start:90 stop:755 length:666 start_codon:yes stop_codon:yes gene_type:complete
MINNRGKIYILTNKMFKDDIIKIGKTGRNDVEDRIRELNSLTGVPFPFECYSAFELDNYHEVEKILHTAYAGADKRTFAKKEFFEINPEKARLLLSQIAKISNGVEIMLQNDIIYSSQELININYIEKKEENKNLKTKSPFKFYNYGINEGEELVFTRDESIRCKVSKNNTVSYDGNNYSLSALTTEIMRSKGIKGSFNGYRFWKLEDEILWDLRERIDGA